MKKVFKWLLLIVVVVIIVSLINNSKQETSQPTETTPPPVLETMKVTAKQIADDFDANQVAAEVNWGNKLVEFSAVISNITDSGISFSNVASKQLSMAQISCLIKEKEQLMPLKNGQTVTVKGIVGKQTIGVIALNDCEVIE